MKQIILPLLQEDLKSGYQNTVGYDLPYRILLNFKGKPRVIPNVNNLIITTSKTGGYDLQY